MSVASPVHATKAYRVPVPPGTGEDTEMTADVPARNQQSAFGAQVGAPCVDVTVALYQMAQLAVTAFGAFIELNVNTVNVPEASLVQ